MNSFFDVIDKQNCILCKKLERYDGGIQNVLFLRLKVPENKTSKKLTSY